MSYKSRIGLISYILLSSSFFIGFFNRFSPATFSSYIADSLELSLTVVGSIAAVHFWIYTIMQVPAGLIVDRYGIRIPAGIGTLISGVGTIIIGAAFNYWMALIGSSLVGLGMSLVFVAVMKNNAIWFDGNKFGFITGLTLLIGTLGAVFSETPALLVLQHIHWRYAFIYIGIITLVIAALILILWRYPSLEKSENIIHTKPTKSLRNQSSFWIQILSNKQLIFIMLAISGTNGTFYAFSGLWGTHLFSNAMKVSDLNASIIITLALLVYGFSSLFFGKISDYLQTRKLFIWLSALINLLSWLWLLFLSNSGVYSAYFCFLLIGLSAGIQVVVCFAAVKESLSLKVTGFAIAFVNMGVFLTTAVIQSLYGWIVSNLLSFSMTPSEAYLNALWLPFILSLIGLFASFPIIETYTNSNSYIEPTKVVRRTN